MNKNYTISTEELESIEQYLLGKCDAEQTKNFETKFETDPLWASKVNEVKLLLLGIESTALKERLDVYHTQLKKNAPSTVGGKIIPWQRKVMVAASVILVAAISVWLLFSKENRYEKLYAKYYKPDPGLMSAMGIGDNYAFNKAMIDYKTGDYNKAILEWGKLKNSMSNDTLDYFLGVAQQANGNDTAAIALLRSMVSDPAKPFYRDACWYMGLALVKQGKVEQAIPMLKRSGYPESAELISKIK